MYYSIQLNWSWSNSIRTKKLFKSEHVNFPSKELNVTDIKKKTQNVHIRIMNLFPSCYVFLIKSKNTKKKKDLKKSCYFFFRVF